MVLTFNKQGNVYVAEFQLAADANLHVEREGMSRLIIHQRSVNGEYALVNDTDEIAYDNVVDVDLQGLVYPKWIKVSTADLPTLAEVVSSGEVTEIKSQSKEVEIVSNGTTEVTPDSGYSYLSGVTVKVNVPQEGGGGSSVVYLNIESVVSAMGSQIASVLDNLPGILAVKLQNYGLWIIRPVSAVDSSLASSITCAAILPQFLGFVDDSNSVNSDVTIEQLKQLGATEITEEEFYNLETA